MRRSAISWCLPPLIVLLALSAGAAPGQPHGDHRGHEEFHPLPPEEVALRYRFGLESDPATPVAGREAALVLTVGTADGKPVTDLQVNHERLLHVLLVGRNLEDFQHLHPEDQGTLREESVRRGRYPFKATFAQGGTYRVTVDLAHGGHSMTASFAVEVDGPPQRRTRWNRSTRRNAGDLEVTMASSDGPLHPRRPATLTFTVRSGGRPVDDLEPWLGAPAHLALYADWAVTAEHLHGDIPGGDGHGSGHQGHGSPGGRAEDFFAGKEANLFGPSVAVTHSFANDGWHRIFLQFQRAGRVYTLPFDLEVEEERSGD